MIICNNNATLGFSAYIIEPEINNDASDYIVNNYNTLIEIIKKLNIKDEKAHDLLHDVFVSIVEAENDGNGFDMEYWNKTNDEQQVSLMCVQQFVIGRIKQYAKNAKYRTDIIEAGSTSVKKKVVYYDVAIGQDGHEVVNSRGNVKAKKRVEYEKVKVMVTTNAATFNDGGEVTENNDDFQKAFAVASVADSTDDIAEMYSLRDQINYCIDICDLHNINIMNMFKNMDMLAGMLGETSKKKKSAESVFKGIYDLINRYTDFGNALMDVLSYSVKNRAAFDIVIGSI